MVHKDKQIWNMIIIFGNNEKRLNSIENLRGDSWADGAENSLVKKFQVLLKQNC